MKGWEHRCWKQSLCNFASMGIGSASSSTPTCCNPSIHRESPEANDGPWDQITSQLTLPGITIAGVGGTISQMTDVRDKLAPSQPCRIPRGLLRSNSSKLLKWLKAIFHSTFTVTALN